MKAGLERRELAATNPGRPGQPSEAGNRQEKNVPLDPPGGKRAPLALQF